MCMPSAGDGSREESQETFLVDVGGHGCPDCSPPVGGPQTAGRERVSFGSSGCGTYLLLLWRCSRETESIEGKKKKKKKKKRCSAGAHVIANSMEPLLLAVVLVWATERLGAGKVTVTFDFSIARAVPLPLLARAKKKKKKK
ncbi:hypothetical protein IWX48DRAFT_441660 [Phyllosticta citricarpa]